MVTLQLREEIEVLSKDDRYIIKCDDEDMSTMDQEKDNNMSVVQK